MSAVRNKQRLLHLYKYLMENTDEEHQVTTNELVTFLKKEDANASRKTVRDDIEVLIEEGVDVIVTRSYCNSYFIGERQFEVPEIKLLIDGIAANRSLTTDKKVKIISDLLGTLSKYQREKLQDQIHYSLPCSSGNERFFYNLDTIVDAINNQKKVRFQYLDFSQAAKKILRNDGEIYQCSPYRITCSNNRFYMIGYTDKKQDIVCFRIDRMLHTELMSEKGKEMPQNFDIDSYINHSYDMCFGEEYDVVLRCDNETMHTVIDNFGTDAKIWRADKDSFCVKARANVSPTFFSWVFQFAGAVRIVSPVSVRTKYQVMLHKAARSSEGK